jgi:hypothetical protein
MIVPHTIFPNLLSPYRIQSPVSLSIFRDFVSALEGNTIVITNTKLTEFEKLCEEFGFHEVFKFLSAIGSLFAGVQSARLSESFQFVVNDIDIEIATAAALCRSVREQLLVDGCARKFVVNDNRIETKDIRSLEFLRSKGRSQISLLLGN